ncbi:MAG TPA: hypothetical protein VH253_01185 [Phycisphaerae bacterium]|nr:hypothetical protein [Phycisphaerae bacterium]
MPRCRTFVLCLSSFVFFAAPLLAQDKKPTEISAADLCAAVAKDANAAGSQYGGDQLIVTGTVAEIQTGNYNNVKLAGPKEGDGSKLQVLCNFPLDAADQVKALKKGQKIRIRGQYFASYSTPDHGGPNLIMCKLLPAEPATKP